MSARSLAGRVRRGVRAWARRLVVRRWQRSRLPRAFIDLPTDAQPAARAIVPVHGWAMFASGPPDRVELTVDGAPAGAARICVPRPDLPGAVGTEHGLLAGFEHLLDLSDVDAAVRTVELGGWAVSREGARHALPTVRLALDAAAAVPLDGAAAPRAALLHERSLRFRADGSSSRGEEPLRVLVVTHDLGVGGGQLVLLELLERFAAAGVSGAVVAPRDGMLLGRIEDAGYPVHVTGDYPHDQLEPYEGRIAELAAWAAPQRFDIVLVNTLSAHIGGELASRMGLPAAWIVHESYGLDGFFRAAYATAAHPHVRARAATAFAAADAIVFECDATRRLFEADAGDAPCLTLPYGIDVAALDAWAREWPRARARAALGFAPQDDVVVCIGTIEPRKAQPQLVEAFARVAAAHPRSRLVLVGDRGDPFGQAPGIAAALHGIGDRVRIEPVLPDVRPFYAAADVLACASDVESLPRSVLEAMALRLPVLATDVFGLPEVVRDGETGWLCAPRDTAALAAGLARALATPPQQRRALAEAARALVVAEHESGACAGRYLQVLADAARRAPVAVGHDR